MQVSSSCCCFFLRKKEKHFAALSKDSSLRSPKAKPSHASSSLSFSNHPLQVSVTNYPPHDPSWILHQPSVPYQRGCGLTTLRGVCIAWNQVLHPIGYPQCRGRLQGRFTNILENLHVPCHKPWKNRTGNFPVYWNGLNRGDENV